MRRAALILFRANVQFICFFFSKHAGPRTEYEPASAMVLDGYIRIYRIPNGIKTVCLQSSLSLASWIQINQHCENAMATFKDSEFHADMVTEAHPPPTPFDLVS